MLGSDAAVSVASLFWIGTVVLSCRFLDISDNGLVGAIPETVGGLATLTYVALCVSFFCASRVVHVNVIDPEAAD